MASQNVNDGKMLSDKDHQCFNAFLECNFEYRNHVADYYTKVAPEYDEFMSKTGYNGPRIVGKIVNDLVEDKSSWLVDICGGTGMSGQEVRRQLFYEYQTIRQGRRFDDETIMRKDYYSNIAKYFSNW
ncbi:hypothetical protein D918_04233 [Trichuris suis]|nr:hypothetical protein D918_04233 [Trichuris suis]